MKINRELLMEFARQAALHAYVPYSHYPVGAALLGEDGQIYSGCNIENESYGSTLCAERVACVKMVSSGVQKFMALAVFSGEDYDSMSLPCGACRQFLNEFAADGSVPVICFTKDGTVLEKTFSQLFPGK